jgi:hypothetical protein
VVRFLNRLNSKLHICKSTFYCLIRVCLRLCLLYYILSAFLFHWLYSPRGPWPLLFNFMIILQTVGLLGRVISPSQGLYLKIGQHKHRINTYTHRTSMPFVGFEPTIPASERAKTVHASDRSATVTGTFSSTCFKLLMVELEGSYE